MIIWDRAGMCDEFFGCVDVACGGEGMICAEEFDKVVFEGGLGAQGVGGKHGSAGEAFAEQINRSVGHRDRGFA